MYKKILLSIVFAIAIFGGFYLTNSSNQANAISENWRCEWQNSAKIECRKPRGGTQLVDRFLINVAHVLEFLLPIEILPGPSLSEFLTNVSQDFDRMHEGLYYDKGGWWYQPHMSQAQGYPTFCRADGDPEEEHGCLHFYGNKPFLAYHDQHPSDSYYGGTPAVTDDGHDTPNHWGISGIGNALKPAGGNTCSIIKTDNCDIENYSGSEWTGGPVRNNEEILVAKIRAIIAFEALQNACEQAPLDFIVCPIFEATISGIEWLIGDAAGSGDRQGPLIDMLTIKPLATNVIASVVAGVVSVANLFYIIVFLLLIFSSALPFGLDNYTIKKTLPKFIGAVIMTQFAYVICFTIIDLFNLMGRVVPNMIFGLGSAATSTCSGGTPAIFSFIGGFAAMIVLLSNPVGLAIVGIAIFVLIIIALVVLFAMLVAFVYMAMRQLIIYTLVIVSPLAFACWVLPGTNKLWSAWWNNFIRLNAMIIVITGMLAMAMTLSQILILVGCD